MDYASPQELMMTQTPHRSPSLVDQVLVYGTHVGRVIATHPVMAWGMAALIWAPLYGGSTIVAVQLLRNPLPDGELPWDTDLHSAIGSAGLVIVFVSLTYLFLHWRGFRVSTTGLIPRKDRREFFWIPAAFLMACGANLIKQVMTSHAATWFPDHTYLYRTEITTDHALPSLLISMLTAGPAEEIILVPGLILLLVSGRCPPWAAITVAVTARTAFHLYYGLPLAPGFIVWALLLVVIWQVTGTALGALLAHAFNNLVAALTHSAAPHADTWATAYTWISVAGLILMVALIPHTIRTLQTLKTTPRHPRTHLTHCPPITASLNRKTTP